MGMSVTFCNKMYLKKNVFFFQPINLKEQHMVNVKPLSHSHDLYYDCLRIT